MMYLDRERPTQDCLENSKNLMLFFKEIISSEDLNRQHYTGSKRPVIMAHVHVGDLPERLSLITRFFPCFRLMSRRYRWTGAGTWTSGPVVITCCGETFTFIGCLVPNAWLDSMPSTYSQNFPEDLAKSHQRIHTVDWTST